MRYVGFTEYNHDAALAIIEEDGTVSYASTSERYTGIKNDPMMHPDMWKLIRDDDNVTFAYIPPDRDGAKRIFQTRNVKYELGELRSPMGTDLTYDSCNLHHQSHCANAYSTRPWELIEDTVCVSVDGCGEQESIVIKDKNLNLIKHWKFPESLGEIYGRVTFGLGYTIGRDEYIVMGLSAYGEVNQELYNHFKEWLDAWSPTGRYNELLGNSRDVFQWQTWKNVDDSRLVKGICDGISEHINGIVLLNIVSKEDVAATIQKFFEDEVIKIMKEARQYGSKLVYGGGCAQNVLANTLIYEMFDDMHVSVSPHDGGNALGCAANTWMMKTGQTQIKWSPYTGHNIERDLNPKKVAKYLVENKVCGIANGKAEYGPRALGNRSLIADVRYDVKDTVNDIKRRQRFRPFAPAILSEFADEYFDGPMSEHMTYAAKAKHDYSSVTHVDGTARVQLVKPDCESKIRQILEEYYELTGVPMLLNTSLNIRNKPMVNTIEDADEWQEKYKVRVF